MKVRVTFSGAKNDAGMEYEARCDVSVDGACIAHGGNDSDCPEDANMGRNYRFVYSIPEALRKAHEAGKNGEPFELEELENYQD